MAPKSKKVAAEAKPAEEPEAKKQKTEEEEKEEKKEEKKEEEPKFQEPDAPADNRSAVKSKIEFTTAETTLNVVPTVGGKVLASLTDGGMAYLMAGARGNVGQKAGRYMFDVKVMQQTDPSYGRDKNCRTTLRIGFSTSDSSLLMEDSCVYYDSEGYFMGGKKKTNLKGAGFFKKDNVVAVVLNLDSKSPNANTIALYRNGEAMGDPQPLPEALHGKPLYPHVVYRNVSVHVNFGPTALKDLPFKCRLLGGAAASDVEVAPSKAPKDGKHEVVLPVAFPDEGTFDWLDGFMEKNPGYVELSDRKIVQWCNASGIYTKGSSGRNNSNDRPSVNFGAQQLDDMSVRSLIAAVTPLMPRNYVVMEVKKNLIATERKEILKKFNYPCFKKVAKVVMGEPNKEFKSVVQDKLLKDKQLKSDNAWRAKRAEETRKRTQAKMRKEAEKRRKENEKKKAEEKKKKEEERKKKAEEEKKAKEGEEKEGEEKEAKEGEEEKKEEEKKEEPAAEQKPEEPAAEEEEKEEEPEPMETEPPKVDLTDEEKTQFFLKKQVPDIAPEVMSANYARFSTPNDDEGFDAIQYEWQKADKANAYLKDWVMNKKLTTRIDNIRPGQDFKEKVVQFKKLVKEWKDKLAAHEKSGKKKAAKKDGDGEDEADIDIFSVTDVCDVGEGVPLFDGFKMEDWELMQLRFDLSMLIISFKKDCNDPDRVGIPLDHLSFYFTKYLGLQLDAKRFGVANLTELIGMAKDCVSVKDGLMVSELQDDIDSLDIFLKLTEEGRRERTRRIDAGDETARLKIKPPPEPKPEPKPVPKPEPAATPAASKGADEGGAGKAGGKAAAAAPAGKGGKGGWGNDNKGSWGNDNKGSSWGDDNKSSWGNQGGGGGAWGNQGGGGKGKDAGKGKDQGKATQQWGQQEKGGGQQWGQQEKGGGQQWGQQDKGGQQWGQQDKGGQQWGQQGKGGKDGGKKGQDMGKMQQQKGGGGGKDGGGGGGGWGKANNKGKW